MKKILLFLMLICSISAYSTVYYVSDSDGSDGDSGLTEALAWKTLTKVNATTFTAGDQILFKKGDTWYGTLTLKNSGTAGNPITYSSYGTGNNPVISGFTTVSSWVNLGSNIWESTNAVTSLSTWNMVVVNGVNTAMGRFPNANTSNSGYAVISSVPSTTSISSTSLTGSPNWVGAELVLRLTYRISRFTVTSQSTNTIGYYPLFNPAYQYDQPIANGGFFIQNHPATLDQQDEWYIDPTTKKIKIYSTSQPTNVKVATIDNLMMFTTTSISYNTVDGIAFEGSNTTTIGRSGGANGNYNVIRNCTIRFSGYNGIDTPTHYATIENNTISDVNMNGITVSSYTNCNVKGNTITNTGIVRGQGDYFTGSNAGISASYSTDLLCEQNTIINSSYKGISYYGNNVTIKNNYINTFCVWQDDGGGIYTYTGGGAAISGGLVTGNIIVNGIGARNGNGNSQFPTIAAGIYLDQNTQGQEISYNYIEDVKSYGIMMNNPYNINVHHNTIANAIDPLDNIYPGLIRVNNRSTIQSQAMTFSNNILVSKSSEMPVLYLSSVQNNLNLMGTFSNNYYLMLSTYPNAFYIHQPSEYGAPYKSLAGWQTFSGQDTNSTVELVSTMNDVTTAYNATATAKEVPLPFACKKMNGYYVGYSILLQPYTSEILFKDNRTSIPSEYNRAKLTPSGKAIINYPTGRPIIYK